MKSRIIAELIVAIGLLTSARATGQTIYIDTNSVWRFLANGTDPGPAWMAPNFDESGWTNEGRGKFGFGGDGERTVIGAAPNGYTNFYFRHTFHAVETHLVNNLFARFIRDDGVVVYLNGQEAFRTNMPPGPILPATQALAALSGADETQMLMRSIPRLFLQEGRNVIAAEVHQAHGAAAFSSDLGFYLELIDNLPPQPPGVILTNPVSGEVIQSAGVTLNAIASDTDGSVAQVEFFINHVSVGVDTTAPYSVIAPFPPPGDYVATAVVTDDQELYSISQAVPFTMSALLPSWVPFGGLWKYLDDGSDQGSIWRDPSFPDENWASAPAELGYGDEDEAALLSFGPDANNKFITTYFRHAFNVANPAGVGALTLRVVRDDGVAIYLNGNEILRDNLPADADTNYSTPAMAAVEDVPMLVTSVDPTLLRLGRNVLAAEIHQANGTSSDISFDINLITNAGFFAPVVRITAPLNGANFPAPANITIDATAYDHDGVISNVQFYINGALIGTPDMTLRYSRFTNNVPTGNYTLAAVATDNLGITQTARVSIVVGQPLCLRRTNVFQHGVSGYLGAVDTQISEPPPFTNASLARTLSAIGLPGYRSQPLLRFDYILGTGLGRVSPGAIIQSAQLRLTSTQPEGGSVDSIHLHRMLTNWPPGATWTNSFGNDGVQADDLEAATVPDATVVQPGSGVTNIDIPLSTIEQWRDGPQNFGWVLLSNGSDEYRVDSCESLPVAIRPALVVVYCDPPPVIVTHPISQVSPYFATVIFSTTATGNPTWQWFHDFVPIPNATNASLIITNVQRPEVGIYHVTASNSSGTVASQPAELQVELTQTGVVRPGVIATDNAGDLDQFLGGPPPPPPPVAASRESAGPTSLASLPQPTVYLSHGIPVFFSNINAPADPVALCGVSSTRLKWVGHYPSETKFIHVSTAGSSFNTVLTVYTNDFGNPPKLVRVLCDRDSGGNGASFVRFRAKSQLHYIAIGGQAGQSGVVRLEVDNDMLQNPRVRTNDFAFEVTVRPNLAVNVRRANVLSPFPSGWESILTFRTNRDWVFWYTQTNVRSPAIRFYGANEQ